MKKLTKVLIAVTMLTIGANANEWRDAKISQSGQDMWKAIGYTDLKKVKEWGVSEKSYYKAKKWSRNGIKSYNEAKEWMDVGINTPSFAKALKDQNNMTANDVADKCGKLISIYDYKKSNVNVYPDKCFMSGFKLITVTQEDSFFSDTTYIAYANVMNDSRVVSIHTKDVRLSSDFVNKNKIYGLFKITDKLETLDMTDGSQLTVNQLERLAIIK